MQTSPVRSASEAGKRQCLVNFSAGRNLQAPGNTAVCSEGQFCSDDLTIETQVHNPLFADISDEDLAEVDLIDLRTKEMMEHKFSLKSHREFWCSLTQSYSHLAM